MKFIYNAFVLNHIEYAKIYSEINTNYSKYKNKPLQFMHHMELITDHIGIILRTMAIMNTIFICVLRCKEDEYGGINSFIKCY